MSRAKAAIRKVARGKLGLRLSTDPAVAKAAELGLRLAASPLTKTPSLDYSEWFSLRDVAEVCEQYLVARARADGWTWAQIAAALKVSPRRPYINATPLG